jgi:hypothetical protein
MMAMGAMPMAQAAEQVSFVLEKYHCVGSSQHRRSLHI